ncbi:MAG: aspartate--tRNA ligase [Desulfatiglans sp.]|jgi:aspartyl-tRNA synthetase|nr:aspartate--tRNA ligase [Thermodesulfobacteriota bacterium]MEE4352261.1 aspartate--tRNA ligase [Desulfatiglans sp.]
MPIRFDSLKIGVVIVDWRNRVYCGELSPGHVGTDVQLMGWVDAIRDHGNLLFIHLIDIRGIIQVVFDPKRDKACYEKACRLNPEYVIQVRGRVEKRAEGTENPHIAGGDMEVFATDMTLLSKSKPLPFQISEKAIVFGEEIQASPEKVDEELRLRYRYLDFRRPSVKELFVKRYRIMKCIRECLDKRHFLEIETPVLTKSTPEGARDYLVPSRVHHGKFYSLPQSPQLFKQLLMIGGMDRYFQIARCFRDEDLRPNRQPEFTQLDLEASFVDEEFIYDVVEELLVKIFAIGKINLHRPFPRMTYQDAMDRFGTDRPDLRFDMAFYDVTDILAHTGYSIFKRVIENRGVIKGFCVKGGADLLSKNVLQNEYAMKTVPLFGGKGMTWMKVIDGRLESNIVQFFTQDEQERMINLFKAKEGDVLMLIADSSPDLVNRVLCSLRLHVAERLGLVDEDVYRPLWVIDFPLFELKEGRPSSLHHPFTMPDRTDFDPADREGVLRLNSRSYDVVMNGEELGGGSIRVHDIEVQKKIFQVLGLTDKEAEEKFGFFLTALEYGAPPHGGLALGIDRVIAMILRTGSIRDVIAFPKNRRAICPLTEAPSSVDPSQLDELGLALSETTTSPEAAGGLAEQVGGLDRDRPSEKISQEEVRHVGRLARLQLSDAEIAEYQRDLNAILDYVDTLKELETEGVEPMSHVLKLKNVWREDGDGKRGKTEDLLSNAPMTEKGYYKVPRILEG